MAEGLTEHEFAHEVLRGPAFADELAGEPVEQFGVRGFVAEAAEVIGRGDEAGAEDPLPHAVHIDAGGERMLGMQQRFGEGETVGDAFARQHFQRGGLDEFARGVHIATDVERILHRHHIALVHAVHRAWEGDAGLDAAIVGDELDELGAGLGLVGQQSIREQPIEHLAVAWTRFVFAPAAHGGIEPCSDAFPRRDGLVGIQMGEHIEFILRRASGFMRDDTGDAEPASFVVAEVVVFEALGQTGAWWEVRIQRGGAKLDGDLLRSVFQLGVGEESPLRLGIRVKRDGFVLEGVVIDDEMAAELASSEAEAHELAWNEMLRRHAQASGQFRAQSVRMPSTRQQACEDVFAFESDERRAVVGLAIFDAFAFKDPTQGGAVGNRPRRLKSAVPCFCRFASFLPFGGQFLPARRLSRIGGRSHFAAHGEAKAAQQMIRAIRVHQRDRPVAAMRQIDGFGEGETRDVIHARWCEADRPTATT